MSSIKHLITSPNQFLANERNDPRLLASASIVGLTGVLYGLSGLATAPARIQQYQGEAILYLYAGLAFSGIATVLMTFLLWVFYSGAFFTIGSLVFGSDGEFRDVFVLTGWGFIGQMFAGVASLVSRIYILQRAGTDPQAIGQMQAQPAFLVASIIGMVAFFWSAGIWNYAVQHTLYLPLRKSIVTVGVPVVFSAVLFYLLNTLPLLL